MSRLNHLLPGASWTRHRMKHKHFGRIYSTVRNLLLKSAKIWDKSFFRLSVNAQRINANILLQSLCTKEQGRIFHLQELICFVKFMTVTPHPHQRFEHSPWCRGRVVFTGKEATVIWGLHPSLTFLGLSVLKEEFILRVRPHYVHVIVHDNHLANVLESLNLS